MKCFAFLIACLLSMFPSLTEQGNILGLFPHFGYSHFQVFYPLMMGLAEKGHNVTVVSYFKSPVEHHNYHEMILRGQKGVDVVDIQNHTASRSLWFLFMEFVYLHGEGQEACEVLYNSRFIREIQFNHNKNPFDVVILEIFNTDCHYGLAHTLQVPIVALSSCALMPWHYRRVALPDMPSYIQSEFIGYSEELDFNDRLVNFVAINGLNVLHKYSERQDNEMIRKKLGMAVDVFQLVKRTSLILVNQHYSLSGNRPLTTQVKEIGGIHIPPEKKWPVIPERLQKFMNASDAPLLFISFGSMIKSSTMPREKVLAIVKALIALKFRVVWRWDGDDVPHPGSSFFYTKWAPQLSVICHPNLDVFWGHGGLLSTTEATHCATPMVLTPFYGDQFLNAKAVENRRTGIILEYHDITEKKVVEVFSDIMKSFYRKRAVAVSKSFRKRENPPLASAIWWIEHVMNDKTAAELMRTKAVDLNWFIYYSFDAIGLLIFSFIVPYLVTYCPY